MTQTTLFLTGATGFLGAQIARLALKREDVKILALVRASNVASAEERLRREWWDWPELRAAVGGRVEALCGDVTRPNLDMEPAVYAACAARVTHILHSAADIRLFAPLEVLRAINVDGTSQMLNFALQVQAAHGLVRFAYISTAFVAGKHPGLIREEDLSDRFGFTSPYEQSKFEAERLVRQAQAEFPISIFRPSMIVGDSRGGAIKTFNTLYYPLRLYLTGRLGIAPARPEARINLVPVDYVADSVVRLLFDPRAAGLTFHLAPQPEDMPSLSELSAFARAWAKREMGLKLPPAVFLPLPGLDALPDNAAAFLEKIVPRDLVPLVRLLPYFQRQPRLARDNSDRLLGPYPHPWRAVLPPLLDFAVRRSFWSPSPRNVYEQVLLRLKSASRPVRYHDLVDGKDILRSGLELRGDILSAAVALRRLGVRPGKRVALEGQNSSRYFSLLVANGLAGGVSAPFYATLPPEEIQALLEDCQASVFLVGAPQILSQLDQIRFSGLVVSFARGPVPQGVLGWEEFLALGKDAQEADLEPQRLDSPAVQVYTSGTTGKPKGVVFHHAQLRWLAETLASMYPWRERNRRGSYLSYLPMNHVVEGILGSFSPYYVPAALDIFFLEEFDRLPEALRQARPTIFFSVPRFFEKVRAAFNQNPLARFYLRLPAGFPRRALRGLLRRGLLRKAGLDGCKQMIVGSAPSDAGLLSFFQELGIEVHDAYGLTEAPLVALNRLGRNRVGTLGRPLPETELRVSPDGEVQVRGPQTADACLTEGWLDTGDLGQVTPDGFLILNGRKKEMLITSYARKIFPAPVEARLRAIPNVGDALLLGEGKPYCSAFLWLETNRWNPQDASLLDQGVAAVNARLPNAEQIKRWAVLPGQLSVESGALTGSLKIRRGLVSARLADEIERLYRGEPLPGALHCGEIPRG